MFRLQNKIKYAFIYKSEKSRIKELSKAIRAATFRKKHSYGGEMIAAINEIVGVENYRMVGRINVARSSESPFYHRKDLVNAKGEYKGKSGSFYVLAPESPSEFYHFFEGLMGLPTLNL